MNRDDIFEATMQNTDELRHMYRSGKIPKLKNEEFELLKFCHDRNMREFLREEFRKHPINLDSQGNLVGENPFKGSGRHFTTMFD